MPISQAIGDESSLPRGYGGAYFFKPDEAIKAGKGEPGSIQLVNAGAFSAVKNMMAKMNNISLRSRLTDELHGIKPQCDASIAQWAAGLKGGTGQCYDPHLVGTVIIEVVSVNPGPAGTGDQMMFWAIFQGDIGLDPSSTIAHTLSDPNTVGGYAPILPPSRPLWLIFWYQFEIPKVTAVGVRGG